MDLSYGDGSDRRAYFRNEVEAAMQRVRGQEATEQRNQRNAANNFHSALGAILQRDAGSPPSPPRPRPLPPPTPVANPNSVYRVLTIEPSPLSQTPGRMTYQDVIDRHRTRVKAPARKFMALVDLIQEKISDNTYLEMANTCKEMYEIIEELEPTSIEGFRVSEERDDDAGPTIQERIQELEEENERLARVANETEYTNIKRLKTIVDLRRKLESQTALVETQAKHLKAQDQIYAALKAHPFVGPGIYHLKAVTAIKEGIEGPSSRLPRWFNGHVKDEWRLKPHIIKTVAPPAPPAPYVDTEYAGGFGALGFGLDDLDALWRVWEV